MPLQPVKVPQSLADFVKPNAADDMQRIEDLLNALQNLKVQMNIAGATRVVNANIQFSGDSAIIVIDL